MSSIRPYRPSDHDDIADICVRTGDSGADATGQYVHPGLLPDVYALPYVAHDPDLAFVVDDGTRAIGYVIATADTAAFAHWFDTEWWPSRASAYALTGEESEQERGLITAAADPDRMLVPAAADYPAHLHIDLLPETQGQGLGRALVETLVAALRSRGVRGLHLTAGIANKGALAFYDRIGFTELERDGGGVTFGMRL